MAAPIQSLLEEISGVEDPIEELQSLKTALLSIPLSALRDSVIGQRFDVIFALLNSNNREQIDLCVDILERILMALSPEYLAQNYRAELHAGLNHPKEAVKILALTQIGRMVEHPTAVTDILNNQDILQAMIQCIAEEKMAVAKQLVVEISSVSPISLGYCANSSLISQLLSELTGDDVLIRATAIEMVTTLAHSQHGRQYLAQQGIMDKISNMIRGAETDPFSSLYLPGEKFKAVLIRMSQLASSGATELRVRSLDAIAQLLSLESEQQTEDLLALTESWFHLLSKQPMDMIRNISTQPFPELHCGALRIFTAIATQPWGQRLMINTPGFMEFILDRSTGQNKEAKDAKFELVGSLVSSSTAAEILGSQHYISLKTYLREGPYYVSAVASVSTEGAD
ncbi:hypothetical protein INR49_025939 [Caranx melampygus]|nr:hypothetical protein INR49_025939 [Caranx melampygus]